MDCLEQLAQGVIPTSFPFKFNSDFDPASPKSLILAFFPETSNLNHVDFEVTNSTELPPPLKEYVEFECHKIGWVPPTNSNEDLDLLFYQIWLRKCDFKYNHLYLPNDDKLRYKGWYKGILRTLISFRKLQPHIKFKLREFEVLSPQSVFDMFIGLYPQTLALKPVLDTLVIPYLSFKHEIHILNTWIESKDLKTLESVIFDNQLTMSALKVCLNTKCRDYQLVSKVIDQVPITTHTNEHNVGDDAGVGSGVGVGDDITVPTTETIEFWKLLVSVSSKERFNIYTFKQLVEWSFGSEQTQRVLFADYIQSNKPFHKSDLQILHKTIFSKLKFEEIISETVKQSISKSKFMFVKSVLPNFEPLVAEQVIKLCDEFDNNDHIQLPQVLTAIEMIGNSDLQLKFSNLNKIQKSFNLDPHFAKQHTPLENARKILEQDTKAYLRFSELTSLLNVDQDKLAEMCIEAALVDDNFEAVMALIDDRKLLNIQSEGCWLAYYQAGKYVSPNWEKVPLKVLKTQQRYLAKCLTLCPERDLVSVLNAWNTNKIEVESEEQEVANSELMKSNLDSDLAIESNLKSSTEMEPQILDDSSNDDNHNNNEHRRDPLSNLLVSGIGWAIGANPR